MINVVSGGTIPSSSVTNRLSFEQLVCGQQSPGPNVTLERLGELRQNPSAIPSNLVLEPETIMRELANGSSPNSLICDVTTIDEGRDVDGLERISRKLNVNVAYGASVSTCSSASEAESALRRELEVGKRRAAFITLRLPVDKHVLEGALGASHKTGALVVVSLREVATVEHFFEVAMPIVDMFGKEKLLIRSPNRLDPQVLSRLGCFVLVDGFGRPLERIHAPDFDVDDKERIRSLSNIVDNHDDEASHLRLAVSVGVRYKTHLKIYGGLGFDFAARLLADVRKKDLLLLNRRVLDILAFYRPPKKAKYPVAKLQCSLCARYFEVRVGYHYAKHDFVYCSRECLDRHRNDQFSTRLVQGPTATDQML